MSHVGVVLHVGWSLSAEVGKGSSAEELTTAGQEVTQRMKPCDSDPYVFEHIM